MTDWSELNTVIALGALVVAAFALLSRSFDKSLSIREHEAYKDAVSRDIARVETRLGHIEQSRPTTGELQIVADALNKRMDLLNKNH
jgi:hypothetical protein